MDLYFTVDVEITDHRLSYSENLDTQLTLPYFELAERFCEADVKATFYLSIAPKALGIDWNDYLRCLKRILRYNRNEFASHIRIQPHLHCLNLPFDYCKGSDFFSDYTPEQQVEMLKLGRQICEDGGVEVTSFRPGGFKNSDDYYAALAEAGFAISSTMRLDRNPAIDLKSGAIDREHGVFEAAHGVIEYPVTSVHLHSVKGRDETINLSPDFFELASVGQQMRQLDYINLNFHSFSWYHGRPVRERFPNMRKETIKHLIREFVMKKLLKPLDADIVTDTIYREHFDQWLAKLPQQGNCLWVGERSAKIGERAQPSAVAG